MAKKKTTTRRQKTTGAGKSSARRKSTSKKAASGGPRKKTKTKVTRKKTTKSKTAKKSSKKTARRKQTTKKSTKTGKKKVSKTTTTKSGRAKKVKTSLTGRELSYFRKLLLEKRTELVGDLGSMGEEALKNQDSANLSHYADHMADIGSDNFEQELTLGLMESERVLLREIDAALDRIADKTYGVCEVTGKPINKARLEAKPWAKYSIEAAREMERNGNGQF